MPDESARPLCGMPVVPDESERPSCGVPVGVRRVPCQNESRSMPVVPASPVRERVPVNTRHLPCPGPTYACGRRRQPRFTNIFSFALPWRSHDARSAARLRRGVGPPSSRNTDAGRSYTDVPLCRTATSAHRSPFIGIGARENRRSMTPMPDRDHRAPISLHGYRSAGKPAIHDAHAGHEPARTDHHSWVAERGKTGDP